MNSSTDYSTVYETVPAAPAPAQPSSKPLALGHRSQELDWCRTHTEVLRQFAGQWVVLEGEKIVVHGSDPLQVVAEARAKGIRVPYIFFVEDADKKVVRMGL